MQVPGESGRLADARALGRGIAVLADILATISPDIVLVLGDRIEAFAAASAAAIGGIRVAHIHGGDRAEGVADESMRHAITKLAHVHFPASAESAQRILSLGEQPATIHLVGSPSVDGLAAMPALGDARYGELGAPEFVFLMHPCGRSDDAEYADAAAALDAAIVRSLSATASLDAVIVLPGALAEPIRSFKVPGRAGAFKVEARPGAYDVGQRKTYTVQ